MYEFKNNFRNNLISDIDSGHAVEIKSASFRDGEEDEIITRFYRLWGVLVRSVENRRNSTTRFFRVDGENLEIFIAIYGQ